MITSDGMRLALIFLLAQFCLPHMALAGEAAERAAQQSPAAQPAAQDEIPENLPQESEGDEPPPGGGFTLQSSTGHVSLKDLRGKVVQYYRVELKGSDLPYAVNHHAVVRFCPFSAGFSFGEFSPTTVTEFQFLVLGLAQQ